MSVEELRALARRWQTMNNEGRLELAAEVYAADCVVHGFGMTGSADSISPLGPENFLQGLTAWRTAMPDYHVTLDDVLVDGDRLVLNVHFTGTQTGPFRYPNLDIPPSGRRLDGRQLIINRVAGGKVVEVWSVWDNLSVLHQLGAPMPPPLFSR